MPSSTVTDAISNTKFVFTGSFADDLIYGAWGDTTGSAPQDYNSLLDAEGGDDFLKGDFANDVLLGGDGDDTLLGGAGDDVLDGGAGNDMVDGGSGNDTVLASASSDVYTGGDGFDTLDFSAATAGLTIDVSKGTASGGDFVSTFASFEKVVGSAFGDQITGSDRVDVINGGAGNDVIRSKAGADLLTGGEGRDTFVFMKKDVMLNGEKRGVDVITDFKGNDLIDLFDFFKGKVAVQDADSVVHLTNTVAGTIVSAKLGADFVDVALLQGMYIPTDTSVAALASDGFFVL